MGGGIKRPYKELITTLLNSSFHVIICGREGAQFEEDPESGELKAVGTKMKAEGETPYEPNILLHMQSLRAKDQTGIINAFAVKDRIGVLAQKFIPWPNFENIVKPLLPYLGETQGQIQTADEQRIEDSGALFEQQRAKSKESAETLKKFLAQYDLCEDAEEFKALAKTITKEVKASLTREDLQALREKYLATKERLK